MRRTAMRQSSHLTGVAVAALDAGAVLRRRDAIARVHQAAFGKDDVAMAAYRDNELPEIVAYSSFRCVAAYDGDRLVGVALGYDASADPVWYGNVSSAVRATRIPRPPRTYEGRTSTG